MKRFTLPPSIGLLVLIAMLPALAEPPVESIEVSTTRSTLGTVAIKIDDSRCFVGVAAVKLIVSELKPTDGNLVATYAIEVPLRKSSNDAGIIVLPIDDLSIAELSTSGGVLIGTACSDKKGATPNKVICQVLPQENKGILLEITTDTRVLNFVSRFKVIDVKSKG